METERAPGLPEALRSNDVLAPLWTMRGCAVERIILIAMAIEDRRPAILIRAQHVLVVAAYLGIVADLAACGHGQARAPAQSLSRTPPALEGAWAGTLRIGGGPLRLVVKFRRKDAGWVATLDSIDQHAEGIAIDAVAFDGHELTLRSSRIQASFAGRLEGKSLLGTFRQHGVEVPLVLTKASTPPAISRRPQQPVRPLPYDEIELVVDNPSGRDHGIAALRCDDRGSARSTGDYTTATTFDFVGDTLAELAVLRARTEIDPARVGLVGHSEGAIVAPIAAVKSNDDQAGDVAMVPHVSDARSAHLPETAGGPRAGARGGARPSGVARCQPARAAQGLREKPDVTIRQLPGSITSFRPVRPARPTSTRGSKRPCPQPCSPS